MNWSGKIKQFLHSKYFADGVKITIGLMLPTFVMYQFDMMELGISISLGALGVALVDTPGPISHRRNAMLITIPLIFLTALLTGLLNGHIYWLAAEIGLFCFFFSMLNVYGVRAGFVGTATLLVMLLGIDQSMTFPEALRNALLVMAGGIWYTVLSLSVNEIWPFRASQQALGEAILQVSKYMHIKAKFYNPSTDIAKDHSELTEEQILVNQQLDFVRDILFRTRSNVKDSNPMGRQFILTFVDVVDLFEQTTASHYDYQLIRDQFGQHKILHRFEQVIIQLSQELRSIGLAFHNNEPLKPIHHFEPRLNVLKRYVDELEKQQVNVLVLKKILVNMRNIAWRIEHIYAYQENAQEDIASPHKGLDLKQFINKQDFNWRLFRNNLSFKSGNFRHALRVSIVCLATFLMVKFFFTGQYSYWILVTVLVILKPGFSLTKQRNYQRVVGTLAGGLMGALILYLIKDETIRFALLLLFMVLAHSFLRHKYMVSVFFLTPFILILFSFLGENSNQIVQERIVDTLIGASIAGLASYFLFPNWESGQLKKVMAKMAVGNANYLMKALERNAQDQLSMSEYRLSRKEMYVAQANLSSAFQRMLSEPKDKQKDASLVHKYVVLSHMLSSYIAGVSELLAVDNITISENQIRTLRKVMNMLKETAHQLEENQWNLPELKSHNSQNTHEDPSLSEILDMIHQTSQDLRTASSPTLLQKEKGD